MPILRQRNSSGFVIYSISPSPSDHQNITEGNCAEESISQCTKKTLGTPRGSESRRKRGPKMPQKKEEGDAALKNSLETVESFSDDVSARRERGKLAQRAFRQRQIDMIRILKDENAKLKEAISNISVSAYRGPTELKAAIDEACRIAEVSSGSSSRYIPSSPSYSHEDYGMASHGSRPASEEPLHNTIPMIDHGSYSWPGSHMDDQSFMNDLGPPALDGGQFPFGTSSIMSYISSGPESSVGAMAQMPPISVPELQSLHVSEQVSPHAQAYTQTHGIGTIDPSLNTSSFPNCPHRQTRPDFYASMASPGAAAPPTPPDDVLPYLGDKAYTVAGQVFWQTLRYGWHILKTCEQSQPTPSTDILATIYSLFHIDATHSRPVAIVKDHIAHRLTFRQHPNSPIDRERVAPTSRSAEHHSVIRHDNQPYPTSGEHDQQQSLSIPFSSSLTYPSLQHSAPLSSSMVDLMVEGTRLAGLEPHLYLNPFSVDERLRRILGDTFHELQIGLSAGGVNATLPSANQNSYTTHGLKLTFPYTSATKRLLDSLATQAIFFADGPRWHADTVSNTAQMWMDSRGEDSRKRALEYGQ